MGFTHVYQHASGTLSLDSALKRCENHGISHLDALNWGCLFVNPRESDCSIYRSLVNHPTEPTLGIKNSSCESCGDQDNKTVDHFTRKLCQTKDEIVWLEASNINKYWSRMLSAESGSYIIGLLVNLEATVEVAYDWYDSTWLVWNWNNHL